MNISEFNDLKHNVIVRLNQVALLSRRLEELLNQHSKIQVDELSELSNHPLMNGPDYSKLAADEGYRTISEVERLQKKDPERYKNIMMQEELKYRRGFIEFESLMAKNIYPNLTLSSLVILAFATFEQNLSLICNALSDLRTIKLRLSDLNGHSTLDKAQRYLIRVLEIPFDFSKSKRWQSIRGHQEVRNLLVHNGGLIDDSDKYDNLRKFIKSHKSVLAVRDNFLILQQDYIEIMIEDSQQFLLEMFDKIK